MQSRKLILGVTVWWAVTNGACANNPTKTAAKPVIAADADASSDAGVVADGGDTAAAGAALAAGSAGTLAAAGGSGAAARAGLGGSYGSTQLAVAGAGADKPVVIANVEPKGPWVSGHYVIDPARLYSPANIDWNGLTHLVMGPLVPKTDGSLTVTYDVNAGSGAALAKQLIDQAHQHGKQAIAMLGGPEQHANWVAATSAANRASFVQNLLSLMQSAGYDGFDLDWEPIEVDDQPSLRALAEALRANAPEIVLLLAVPWVDAYAGKAPAFYGEVAGLFDQINVMSYGMSDSWSGWQSWHSSALRGHTPATASSIESSVDAYLGAGVPAGKLGVGVGFFGSCWILPVTGPRQPTGGSAVVGGDGSMSYANIMTSYYSAEAHGWDAIASVPYLSFTSEHGPRGCSYVSYEDAQSIKAKADYVKHKGLGGALVWTINQGYLPNAAPGQRDPLMQAMSAFLQ